MKFIIISVVGFLLISCTPYVPVPITYDGKGSYEQLQKDRYQCLKDNLQRFGNLAGSSANYGSGVSATSRVGVSCSTHSACLAAKGWKRNTKGTGTPITSVIKCAL